MTDLTQEQIKLLEQNKIIPQGCPQDQITFFVEVCKRKKLDPFQRQIHLVERKSKDNNQWVKSYTIQAGIDGMRAIAQRNAKIKSYKRWVEKREDDLYGICEIDTEDRGTYKDELPFKEYVQKKSDGTVNSFWAKFPQTMIKKCAEESVLRMMTPEDLSGVYGDDEMMQADTEVKQLPTTGENVTVSVALPEPVRDLSDDFSKCLTIKDVKALWKTLSDAERKAYYNLKEITFTRIIHDNIEDYISKLKSNTYESWIPTIEPFIDKLQDLDRKKQLIELYNNRLENIGVEHRYQGLPF